MADELAFLAGRASLVGSLPAIGGAEDPAEAIAEALGEMFPRGENLAAWPPVGRKSAAAPDTTAARAGGVWIEVSCPALPVLRGTTWPWACQWPQRGSNPH